MSHYLAIYDRDQYAHWKAARDDDALRVYDDIVLPDDYGLNGGFACDILNAMYLALHMVGQADRLGCVIVETLKDGELQEVQS